MNKFRAKQVCCLQSPAARNLAVLLTSLTFFGCSSHQAPVSEQGQRLERNTPMILSSNISDDGQPFGTSRPRKVLSLETPLDLVTSVRESLPEAMVSRPAPQRASGLARAPLAPSREEREPPARAEMAAESSFNRLPVSASHLVSAGDTLFSIAFQYDLDFRSLALANGLNPPYTIFVGQQLRLKAASAIAEAVAEGPSTGTNPATDAVSDESESSSSLRQSDSELLASQPRWSWPHQGDVVAPFQPQLTKGVEIAGTVGDAVLAAADGDVVYSGRGVRGTGNLIIIRHSDRYLSAYAHNSVMLVPEGRHVTAGQKIAELGVNAEGLPMLHFEIRQDGKPVDPSGVLPARRVR
ncbi:MAG: hypothetical protein CMQ45_04350 [Gammaproteobacteria bacterium]|nr:hypothetical protein [Gammaproteobacteria bacterium]